MAGKTKALKLTPGKGYSELVKNIKAEFSSLEALFRQLSAKCYWNVGEHIHKYILQNKNRADYGKYVYDLLEDNLDREKSVLHRAVQFYLAYPAIVVGRQQLSWTHYRKLITVRDKDERKKLEAQILQKGWNADRLQEYLNTKRALQARKDGETPIPKLKFTRGKPFVYRVTEAADAESKETALRLDLGFKVGRTFKEEFKTDDYVEVKGPNAQCALTRATAQADEIFTYKARLLKVSDGDTYIVDMDTGLNEFIGQKLRLRGIDCPEIDTEEGKRAKRFVESRLKACEFIIVKTYKDRSDMWDRYLADVFYAKGQASPEKAAAEGTYLNQELLDKGLACVWQK